MQCGWTAIKRHRTSFGVIRTMNMYQNKRPHGVVSATRRKHESNLGICFPVRRGDGKKNDRCPVQPARHGPSRMNNKRALSSPNDGKQNRGGGGDPSEMQLELM